MVAWSCPGLAWSWPQLAPPPGLPVLHPSKGCTLRMSQWGIGAAPSTQQLGGKSHPQRCTKPFSKWGKTRKMPLSSTPSPQKTFGLEPGWALAMVLVT